MTIQHEARPRAPLRLFESGFASPELIEANAERIIASRNLIHARTSGPGFVQLIHGANENVLEVGGQSVGEVRSQLDRLFNINPAASPLSNGSPVTEDHILRHGETLEFLNPFGQKGVGRVWTKDEFCTLFQMSEADFAAMVEKGLPVHRLEDESIRITETQVDEFLDGVAGRGSRRLAPSPGPSYADLSSLIAEIRRIADVMDPPPPDIVDSSYVAGRLGCTTTWIADLARQGKIPLGCLVVGTGDGKPWKFHRGSIDAWIASR